MANTREAERLSHELTRRGWTVERGNDGDLVQVIGGVARCIDGRPSASGEDVNDRGPKIPSGVLEVAAQQSGRNIGRNEVVKATNTIYEGGYTPSVHGPHCLFGELLRKGKIPNTSKLALDGERVRETVVETGIGIYLDFVGEHREEQTGFNLLANSTRDPDGSAFHADLWSARPLGINEETLFKHSAFTVEQSHRPLVAVIYGAPIGRFTSFPSSRT